MNKLIQINQYIRKNCFDHNSDGWGESGEFLGLTQERLDDIIAIAAFPSPQDMREFFFDKEGYMESDATCKKYWDEHYGR